MPTANPPHSSPLPRIPQTTETELPSRFDLRDEGAVTSVKSQVGGTCWAYGAMGAIESNMIKKGMADASLDLSEAHLIWFGRGLGGSADPSGFLYGDGTSLGTNAYDKGGGTYWVCAPFFIIPHKCEKARHFAGLFRQADILVDCGEDVFLAYLILMFQPLQSGKCGNIISSTRF